MTILYVFIDGIGFGKNDPDTNPFARYAHSFFSPLADRPPEADVPAGLVIQETDAHMGIPGLPQSATGQTALWTGVNGPVVMGRHMNGFPGPTLKKTIYAWSMVKCLNEAGRRSALLNAYGESYLRRIEEKPRLASTSTHIQKAAGLPLKTFVDLKANQAVYMDITHELMHEFYPESKAEFPVIDAFQRGRDIVQMARGYDLALYEYFLTDKVGHDQSFPMAERVITTLEKFLAGIAAELNPENELLVITSDHGNLEDLTRKTHTNNKVGTFALGRGAEEIQKRVRALYDIPPVLYDLLGIPFPIPEADRRLVPDAPAPVSPAV